MPAASPGSKSGNPAEPGSLIEVYDNFIVVTEKDGIRRISPHGWYTDVTFKQE
jgi:hypothetical protein